MCDYSLAGLPSRLAVEGEQLVVHRFPTGTLGLASPHPSGSRWWSAKQPPAVCIHLGPSYCYEISPRTCNNMGVGGTEEVTFAQLSETPYQYRDAVRFSNGQEILLQKLQCRQRVEVLSLSAGDFEREGHEKLEEEYQRIFLG